MLRHSSGKFVKIFFVLVAVLVVPAACCFAVQITSVHYTDTNQKVLFAATQPTSSPPLPTSAAIAQHKNKPSPKVSSSELSPAAPKVSSPETHTANTSEPKVLKSLKPDNQSSETKKPSSKSSQPKTDITSAPIKMWTNSFVCHANCRAPLSSSQKLLSGTFDTVEEWLTLH